MSEVAVATSGLTKRFGPQVAVDSLDLLVPTGSVYGFLGPNGSGKTTTIRMLLGLVRPTSGSVELLGRAMPKDGPDVLARVGSLVEGPAFHPYLTGRDNLVRLESADRTTDPRTARARIDGALDRVGLLVAATKRYRAYSLGMRQRLAIASALLRHRDLLVLDEPTNGLDPQGTREVRTLVGSLADEGATVLVSSHLLSEMAQMADEVIVIDHGRLVRQGSLAELTSGHASVRVAAADHGELRAALVAAGLQPRVDGEAFVVTGADAGGIGRIAAAEGIALTQLAAQESTLEDAFLELTEGAER